MTGITQNEQKAVRHATFGILNWKKQFRLNPGIYGGRFNGIRFLLMFWNYNASFNVTSEYTGKDILQSDFSYKFVKSDFRYMYEPDYNNKFVLTLSGAASSGVLKSISLNL